MHPNFPARVTVITRLKLGALLIAAGMLWPATAPAWGPEGHRIVGRIAEMRLTDAARTQIAALLNPGERISDDSVASWADEYRKQVSKSRPWHYVDIPYTAAAYDPARDCPTGTCVIAQIERWERTLANKQASRKKRQQALRFVVHFVGDVHQPLHCISRDDDRGGNERTVLFPGTKKPTNLHATWDIFLVDAVMEKQDVLQCAAILHAAITPVQEQSWAGGSPADWALESHAAAIQTAYAGVPRGEEPPFVLMPAYVRACTPVVETRLQQAGVRLALILNRALSE